MKILKANTYIPIPGEPFPMPLPLKLELYWANNLLCVYSIAPDETVDYTYNINTDIPLLTPATKKLKISDIYFLIRSRVFRDNQFNTAAELSRFGLQEYNPYQILRKTHGIIPSDCYWFRFPDEKITYPDAAEQYRDYYYLSSEQRAEKYKFKTDKPATAYSGIENFLNISDE